MPGAPVGQVLLLLADGTNAAIWEELRAAGELPGLERGLLAPAGLAGGSTLPLPLATSVFPSTTGPAHLPFLTGRFPGPANVPGIRWLDPVVYGRHPCSLDRFRSYMGPGNYLASRDLSPAVDTLFEQLPDHASIAGNVRRGVRFRADLTRWAKPAHNVRSFFVEEWYGMDDAATRALCGAVRRQTTFVFASFYAADSNGHKHGPRHPRTLEAYRRIDRTVGEVADLLAQRGRAAETLIALVADHGLTQTEHHLDLQRLVEGVVGRCLAHPLIWHGFLAARAAVMVSGNAMAHIYLRGATRWGDPVFLDPPSGAVAELLPALLREPAVDLVAGRTASGEVLAVSRRGRARMRRWGAPGWGVDYVPEEGDPFGYPASLAGRHTDQELLARTWDSDYPDGPVQLLQLCESARCGHLIVSATPGHDLRARFEKPAHQGSHGSLHRDHLQTPLLLNRPLPPGPHRTVDLYPTLLQALGLPVPPGLDGRSLLPSG